MSKEPIHHVAIVEDNATLGASLRDIIEATGDFHCDGLWTSAEEALPKIDAFRPQVVLMDINLPGMSGIDATARIKQYLPEIQIVMVTVYGDHDKIFAALKAGASGYLLKRSSPAEVRDAIRDVLSGGAPMSAEIARRVVEAFHPRSDETGGEDSLSQREVEVLEQLSEGLANKEIADRLGIAVDTVRVHLGHIYQKLHVRSRTEAAMKYRDSKRFGPL
ncbi:MAG: response regulator transcription factor [Verrucomicrobiae bacterium]|nr:response regulator transcription factor [Verrucomicrobiae bacterium]MCP5543944.1 response regulator transcription factor [Akkermansiaceae bacterium]MCP5547576.1 response regulator transcription factor [Akkermansiaceae bacterium]